MGYAKNKSNQPNGNGSKATADAPSSRQRLLKSRPVVIVALVALLAVVAFLVVRRGTGNGEQATEEKARKTRIARDKAPKVPQTAPKPPAPPKVEEPKPVDPNARPTKVGEIVNNYIKLPSGKLHYIRGEVTNNVAETSRDWFDVFDHRCETEIACLLTLEPGETLVGTPVYRGRFVKEFLKSLETPIIPDKDDPQEIRDLKKAVTEAKIELKAAYDRGEDIEQIMLDTRSQLQDLAAYKHTLEAELKNTIRNNATSDADIDEFIEAANRLLEEKGVAPLKLNPLARMRLERMIQQKGKTNE